MTTEPKPCPVCGVLPFTGPIHVHRPNFQERYIVHHGCEETPKWYFEFRDDFETEGKAVEAWNSWLEAMKK